jgi:hypothetical protein
VEGGLQNAVWDFQTESNVLWFVKLTAHFSKVYGSYIRANKMTVSWDGIRIYG